MNKRKERGKKEQEGTKSKRMKAQEKRKSKS
jgi:hypothetical protein